MTPINALFGSRFQLKGSNPRLDWTAVEEHADASLPHSYKKFMELHDGGEGWVGGNYLVLDRVSDLTRFNNDNKENGYAPGLFVFGSNGAGEGFAFDLRNGGESIVMVPLIGMSHEDAIQVATNFESFLRGLSSETNLFRR